jgi:probable F420-dependent oxidoreductase
MSKLKIDANLHGLPHDVVDLSEAAEAMGFDGIWTHETAHDAFLPVPLAAEHTDDLDLGTRIALSFTRSPMVLAYLAWDLADYTDGRFILGLGTQVKGHNERRFSVDWESPGPKLREEIRALRHIWDVFQGREESLDFEGDFYSFSLMTPSSDPGPIDHPDVPIYIAGVNEFNLKLEGELCDGLCMHSFTTPKYTEEVIAPTVAEGAEIGDRSLDDVTFSASPFTITGHTEEAIERRRGEARERIAYYGSTRTYHDVFEVHGWKGIGEELHELSTEKRWDEMPALVTDEMLEAFCIEAPPEEIADEVRRRYGDLVDRVKLSIDFDAGDEWTDIVAGFR